MIDYTLTRSNRKTIALYVRDGAVLVRAPYRMTQENIDRFVASKEKWISDRLAKSNEQMALRRSFSLNYGDPVVYQGKKYPIIEKQGDLVGYDGEHFYMPPDLRPEEIKNACVQIYRLLAKNELPAKALEYARKMAVMPTAVRINGAKTRWGSCSSKKSLNFSWRLVMADDDVIDYVVVHELAHITEMNHSARFWALVQSIIPDYEERKARLIELQHRLNNEEWD